MEQVRHAPNATIHEFAKWEIRLHQNESLIDLVDGMIDATGETPARRQTLIHSLSAPYGQGEGWEHARPRSFRLPTVPLFRASNHLQEFREIHNWSSISNSMPQICTWTNH